MLAGLGLFGCLVDHLIMLAGVHRFALRATHKVAPDIGLHYAIAVNLIPEVFDCVDRAMLERFRATKAVSVIWQGYVVLAVRTKSH
jgi:hypothetical protein